MNVNDRKSFNTSLIKDLEALREMDELIQDVEMLTAEVYNVSQSIGSSTTIDIDASTSADIAKMQEIMEDIKSICDDALGKAEVQPTEATDMKPSASVNSDSATAASSSATATSSSATAASSPTISISALSFAKWYIKSHSSAKN